MVKEKLDRNLAKNEKTGVFGETDAAHKFSWEVMNHIYTSSPGRPVNHETEREIARQMNAEENLRIKTIDGNRKLDHRRDLEIIAAMEHQRAIENQATIFRAQQSYAAAQQINGGIYADQLGNIQVVNPQTGRLVYLRNFGY